MVADGSTHSAQPSLQRFAEDIVRHDGARFLADERMRSALTLWAHPMSSGKQLEGIYAPFEHVEVGARLVIVGITPGETQAENALAAARAGLRRGDSIEIASRKAKVAASFSGAMRTNLCRMLDAAGAAAWLGIRTSEEIFSSASSLVHFTSALRNPVFINRANYNGTPDILRTPQLTQTVETALAEEARALPDAMWLPLWDVPNAALCRLVTLGHLSSDRLLPPMPHPSGGNGENIAWFIGQNRKSEFSSRRASTGKLLLERREALRDFFSKA